MAVTNQMLMEELKRLQSCVNELTANIALLCERVAKLEMWRNGHDNNVHPRLREQIAAAQRVQEKQGAQLWEIALKVAEIGTLLIAVTKLAGIW